MFSEIQDLCVCVCVCVFLPCFFRLLRLFFFLWSISMEGEFSPSRLVSFSSSSSSVFDFFLELKGLSIYRPL